MTTHEQQDPSAGNGPEAGATEEAVALHGDRARAEQHEQPGDVVDLPAGTRIAAHDDDMTDE
jgi:hypothetical protein